MGDETQFDKLDAPVEVSRPLHGVVIGGLVGLAADGVPLVDFPGNPCDDPVRARTTATLGGNEVGREVALLFEDGDPIKPILVGPIIDPRNEGRPKLFVQRDAERIELSADHEIVLRCGGSSITLTKAGKVLIRGAYVSSYSSGVNKIKGGAVQIN